MSSPFRDHRDRQLSTEDALVVWCEGERSATHPRHQRVRDDFEVAIAATLARL
jgi:hypothetical protein